MGESETNATSDRSLQSRIRNAFLVWSWVALLGGYLSTSAMLGREGFMLWREGVYIEESGLLAILVASLSLFLPMIILAMGWLVFYRYSLSMYTVSVSEKPYPQDELKEQFSASLRYLVYSWVFFLVAGMIPTMFSLLRMF